MTDSNIIYRFPKRISAALHLISIYLSIIAAITLAAMMLLSVADVIGRYFFSKPITGTYEIVGLLLIFAGTWGFASCQIRKGHISVTIVKDLLPHKIQAGITAIANAIGLIGFSIISWQTFLLGKINFITKGNVSETLGIPYAPFIWALSISSGLMAIMLLVQIVQSILEVLEK
jgi:TRAP-type C4-dicarboxylate transport system permease small subunit